MDVSTYEQYNEVKKNLKSSILSLRNQGVSDYYIDKILMPEIAKLESEQLADKKQAEDLLKYLKVGTENDKTNLVKIVEDELANINQNRFAVVDQQIYVKIKEKYTSFLDFVKALEDILPRLDNSGNVNSKSNYWRCTIS